jgi:hypothetical protein
MLRVVLKLVHRQFLAEFASVKTFLLWRSREHQFDSRAAVVILWLLVALSAGAALLVLRRLPDLQVLQGGATLLLIALPLWVPAVRVWRNVGFGYDPPVLVALVISLGVVAYELLVKFVMEPFVDPDKQWIARCVLITPCLPPPGPTLHLQCRTHRTPFTCSPLHLPSPCTVSSLPPSTRRQLRVPQHPATCPYLPHVGNLPSCARVSRCWE